MDVHNKISNFINTNNLTLESCFSTLGCTCWCKLVLVICSIQTVSPSYYQVYPVYRITGKKKKIKTECDIQLAMHNLSEDVDLDIGDGVFESQLH